MASQVNWPVTVTAHLHPSVVACDKLRPEYHRCTLYQTNDGQMHAVSTGANQTSSRLLSTAFANSFAIIPASASGQYASTSQTPVVVIGDVLKVSKEDLHAIIKERNYEIDSKTVHMDCKCGSETTTTTTEIKPVSKPKPDAFKVFCVTISDRASKGEYPADLSGQAMEACVAGNDRFS